MGAGPFYRFGLCVYAFATGEHPDSEAGRQGEAYDAGLGRHVQAAVAICRALTVINAR